MRALVLGTGGFIGRELSKSLCDDARFKFVVMKHRFKEDIFVRFGDGGIGFTSNPDMNGEQINEFDVIFNCQAWSRPQGDPQDIFYNNVNEPVAFLAELPQYKKPPLFVHLSSIVVENYPLTTYAASKLCSETVVKSFTELGKIRGVVLRPCAVVGGNSTHGLIHDMVRKLKADRTKIEVLSTKPGARKPFIHVNELVDLMVDLALNPLERSVCNDMDFRGPFSACSKNTLSVEQVLKTIFDALNVYPYPDLNWVGEKWTDQKEVGAITDFDMMTAEEAVAKAALETWEKINV